MIDRKIIDEKLKSFFEDLWRHEDPWALETSEFEKQRYESILSMMNDRHYKRVLEIGCGTGTFTRNLIPFADNIVALDISATAIERAKNAISVGSGTIDYRVVNIMEYNLQKEGKWDLVIMSETVYYLGWLYSFFEVGSLASELLDSMNSGGRLVLANTRSEKENYTNEMALLTSWLIDTYRDLFLNVGFKLEREHIFKGAKENYQLEVLISLYEC